MKTYTGYHVRDDRGYYQAPAVFVHEPGRPRRLLDLRHDLREHSEEFNWGYAGSGPAQLALALCADVLGDDALAQEVYQGFKFKVVGRLPEDGWTLTEAQIREAVAQVKKARGG